MTCFNRQWDVEYFGFVPAVFESYSIIVMWSLPSDQNEILPHVSGLVPLPPALSGCPSVESLLNVKCRILSLAPGYC